jgi:hypothetical protein
MHHVTHSQLLEGLKSESKYKTMEGGGVGARSLAHNTLKGRRACWSSGMGLGKVDKLHSLTGACTQPTQGGYYIVARMNHGQHGHTILTTARTWEKPLPSPL